MINSVAMDKDEIEDLLKRDDAVTVRRVLPRNFIKRYIEQYLMQMETMVKSFQAILTFPTTQRDLPRLALNRMHKNLLHDLQHAEKIDAEVDYLLNLVHTKVTLQSNIMLNVIADTPFPFCVLNVINYRIDRETVIPCYVVLWAQQIRRNQPLIFWLQLSPIDSDDWEYISSEEVKSDLQMLRPPAGEVYFSAFNTAISVTMYDVPTEMDATLQGKSLMIMLKELKQLRESLVRRKEQRGNFLHVVWCNMDTFDDYVPVSEYDLY